MPSTVTQSRPGSMRLAGHALTRPSTATRPAPIIRIASLREQMPNFESARASERRPLGVSWDRLVGRGGAVIARGDREGHLPLAHELALDVGDAFEGTGPASEPQEPAFDHDALAAGDRPAVE